MSEKRDIESMWTIPDFEVDQEEEEEERKNLRVKIGKTITIISVWFERSDRFGDFAVLNCQEGLFYNFSKRLQRQVSPFASKGRLKKLIKAKVMLSKQNQVYLTRPDPEE